MLATHGGSGLPPTRAACHHGGSGLLATRAACHPWRFWAASHPSSLPPVKVPGCYPPEQLATHGGSGLPATRAACHPWRPTQTPRLPLSTPAIMHCQTTQDQYADLPVQPQSLHHCAEEGQHDLSRNFTNDR